MSDDLESRLNDLSSLAVGDAPTTGELQLRGRQQSLRRARWGTAAVVLVVAAGGIAGLNLRDTEPGAVATEPPTTVPSGPDATAVPPNDGEPINGPGGTVGWVDREVWDAAGVVGPPLLDIGTGAVEVRGFDVLDAQGVLVGYFVPGPIGFLALERTTDPAAVDVLVRSNEPMSQSEAERLNDELRDQSEGGGS